MKKILFLIMLFANFAIAIEITPNEVFGQVKLIEKKMRTLHKHFDSKPDKQYENIEKIKTKLKPRNTWQKTYEIMIKINVLRIKHKLPIIEPINMDPVLDLNPVLVYEQTQRILTELDIFMLRLGIKQKNLVASKYTNKSPLDVFNALNDVSYSLDQLNGISLTPSYVFGEMMRVYDDLNKIFHHLQIKDLTIPTTRNDNIKPKDTFNRSIKILNKIKQIQSSLGIEGVDFYAFKKEIITPSDVFGMVQMIIAEIQPIKAYIGLNSYITPAATQYQNKTPSDVDQMMGWVLRKTVLLQNNIFNKEGHKW